MKTNKTPTTHQPSTATNDDERGKAAFARLRARLRALPAADLSAVNADVSEAALVAAGVAARVTATPLRARFKAIAGSEFDIAHVDDLSDVAWAAHHAAAEATRLRATGS